MEKEKHECGDCVRVSVCMKNHIPEIYQVHLISENERGDSNHHVWKFSTSTMNKNRCPQHVTTNK